MFYNLKDYQMNIFQDEDYFVATTLEMPTISGCGDTPEEALRELNIVFEQVKEIYIEDNEAMPEPLSRRKYSGQFRVRIPKDLHFELTKRAESEGISLNQLINYLLAKNVCPSKKAS